MKLYFNLDSQEKWHRKEWEALLEAAARSTEAACSLVSDRSSADHEILTREPGASLLGRMGPLKARDVSTIVWDDSDQPLGRLSGLYCSLPRHIFDASRHRTFCYPITYNERVEEFLIEDAIEDFNFTGGLTAPIRSKIVSIMQNQSAVTGTIQVQNGPWFSMFDRSGVPEKMSYASAMRKSKYIVCPRGNGVGSVRLFEVLKAGRVPIIVSDKYVLPSYVDWSACALLIGEKSVSSIPEAIRQDLPNWETRARNARKVWEERFSPAALLGQLRIMVTELSREATPGAADQARFLGGQAREVSRTLLRSGARHLQRIVARR